MFVTLVALSAAAFFETLTSLVAFASSNMTASHVILVPAVTLVLIFQRRETIFGNVRFGLAGLAAMTLGLVLTVTRGGDISGDALSLSVSGLVLTWIGSFLLIYGHDAFRAALFPLLFLVFTVPLPSSILDPATLVLKSSSADVVSGLFTITGTPFHRDGFVFTVPTQAIEIADQCSGIRSTIALILTSLLTGHAMMFRTWSRILLLAVVFPITVLKNGIRIVSLTLLAIHVNPDYLTGQLHHEGGVVFFVLALAMLAPLLYVISRFESRASSPRYEGQSREHR